MVAKWLSGRRRLLCDKRLSDYFDHRFRGKMMADSKLQIFTCDELETDTSIVALGGAIVCLSVSGFCCQTILTISAECHCHKCFFSKQHASGSDQW